MKMLSVTAILAACLAVSIPAHAGQTLDSEVKAGLNAAAAARLAVSEKYLQDGAWPESNEAAGFTTPDGTAADISIGKAGVVTVALRSTGGAIVLTPSSAEPGAIRWSCKATGVPTEALPPYCK